MAYKANKLDGEHLINKEKSNFTSDIKLSGVRVSLAGVARESLCSYLILNEDQSRCIGNGRPRIHW